mmetsp:Transcript_41095/g.95978  ORF Transcript_41095/g.95978 Transcript_41095/m.95978 type:complete len:222 (-) Transcript_41095:444-1109(-)
MGSSVAVPRAQRRYSHSALPPTEELRRRHQRLLLTPRGGGRLAYSCGLPKHRLGRHPDRTVTAQQCHPSLPTRACHLRAVRSTSFPRSLTPCAQTVQPRPSRRIHRKRTAASAHAGAGLHVAVASYERFLSVRRPPAAVALLGACRLCLRVCLRCLSPLQKRRVGGRVASSGPPALRVGDPGRTARAQADPARAASGGSASTKLGIRRCAGGGLACGTADN